MRARLSVALFAASVALLFCAARADLSALIPYTVPVETSKPLALSVMRGESVTWAISFTEGGTAKDLTGAEAAALTYSRAGTSYQIDGTLHSLTGGVVRVAWASTNATAAGSYDYVLAVTTGTVALCRARGVLNVAPAVSTVGGVAPVWQIPAEIQGYSNHVREVYLRGVEVSEGVWTIYVGD